MTSSAEDNPTISLGGTTYAVPPIAFREVSRILPLVGRVFVGMRSNDVSEEVLTGLGRLIFWGITKGQPGLTYEEFIDRPAALAEMMDAALVVCRQAGLKMKDATPGEATGVMPPSTSTN